MGRIAAEVLFNFSEPDEKKGEEIKQKVRESVSRIGGLDFSPEQVDCHFDPKGPSYDESEVLRIQVLLHGPQRVSRQHLQDWYRVLFESFKPGFKMVFCGSAGQMPTEDQLSM